MKTKAPSLSDKTKTTLQLAAGTLVSLAFMALAFRGVDWRSAWHTISQANIPLLLAAEATVLLQTLMRSERWRLMFYPNQRALRATKFFSIFLIGQVINAVIPARLGELARAYLVGEVEHVSKAHALWTAVAEKVLDAFTLLLFLAWLSLAVTLPGWLQKSTWTLTLAIVLVFVGLVAAVFFRPRVNAGLAWLARRFPWSARLRLERLLNVVVDSLRLLGRPQLSLGLSGWSIAAFLVTALTNQLTALAMGLRLPFTASLLLLAVLQISAIVPLPSAPGRVGLFQWLCIVTLTIYQVERDPALSYALVLNVLTYLPMMVGGPICLWLENYDWRGLSRLLQDNRTVLNEHSEAP